MDYFNLADVTVGERQRKEFAPSHIQDLKRSITSKGLLHPIVLSETGALIAGECRLRAMSELHEEGVVFRCHDLDVPSGMVPFTRISDLSDLELQEAEFEENILRANLTWQEEMEAKARIHQIRLAVNPAQSVAATAREIATKARTNPTTTAINLHAALLVNEHRNNPKVKAAKSLSQAHKAILDEIETDLTAELITKGITQSLVDHQLIHGDALIELPKLKPGSVDVILTDPPYGINADTSKGDSQHFYDDSPEAALEVCKAILHHGFTLAKPRAVLFMFCDVDYFVTLRTFAQQQGWSTWRTPLIYDKGEIGHAPWGKAGFVRTSEYILFAVKGQRELYKPGGSDVISSQHHPRGKLHAAEKPVALLTHLLQRAALQGDVILDPCAGSGGIFEACTNLKLRAIGIEKSKEYYNTALVRMHQKELTDLV